MIIKVKNTKEIMKRKIGAHVSASGGLGFSIERAHKIEANCAQIFSGSPRVWKRKSLADFDIEKMFSKRKELTVEPIFTHSLYLVNLASDKPELLRKSFAALKYDLEFDSLIKGSGVIVHLGSHTGRGWDKVKQQVAGQISKLLESTPSNSTFLIENSAGQKGKLCSNLEEISWLLDKIGGGKRLGWCFDTCHAHAAGYTLGKASVSLISKSAVKEISKLKMWSALKCIHVNDSRDGFDSGRDRHENLGKGNIPEEDLKYFLNYQKVLDIPLITEVPGLDKKGPDIKNIKYLKSLCQ